MWDCIQPGSNMLTLNSLEEIRHLLQGAKTIAIVGLSPKVARPSNMVGQYLLDAGYTIIPVNPGQTEILGRKCYPSLAEVPGKIDVVDIFRRAEQVLPVVQDAIAVGAGAVWMQEGIVNEEAAQLARASGLTVIMDRCIKIDHQQML